MIIYVTNVSTNKMKAACIENVARMRTLAMIGSHQIWGNDIIAHDCDDAVDSVRKEKESRVRRHPQNPQRLTLSILPLLLVVEGIRQFLQKPTDRHVSNRMNKQRGQALNGYTEGLWSWLLCLL